MKANWQGFGRFADTAFGLKASTMEEIRCGFIPVRFVPRTSVVGRNECGKSR